MDVTDDSYRIGAPFTTCRSLLSLCPYRGAYKSQCSGIDGRGHWRAPDKASLVSALIRLGELLLVECLDASKQVELVAQVRAHHLRAVGRDCELDAGVDERPECVPYGVLVSKRSCQQVRRRADLQDDLGVAQCCHQLRVVGSENPVADPVRPEDVDDLAYLLASDVAAFLADVDRDAEPGSAGALDERRQLAIRVAAGLRASA